MPLQYLIDLGVDVANDVDWILASHAHDDHIDGLAEVARTCTNATVVMTAAATAEEIFSLAHLDKRLSYYGTRWRIYSEFHELWELLRASDRYLLAAEGIVIPFGSNLGPVPPNLKMTFVAPSAYAQVQARKVWGQLLERASGDQVTRLAPRDPNTFSAAVLIETLGFGVLLTGDVKNGAARWGWNRAVQHFDFEDRVDVHKVAHHGDPRAHHAVVWDEWMNDEAVALVAPYRSSRRPRPDDVARILSHGHPAWTSADAGPIAQPRSVRRVAASMHAIARNVEDAAGLAGRVTYRRVAGEEGRVEVVAPASQLT